MPIFDKFVQDILQKVQIDVRAIAIAFTNEMIYMLNITVLSEADHHSSCKSWLMMHDVGRSRGVARG